jgi:hypothetical protein
MRTVVISQPMLFPWVGQFEQMKLADVFVHYDDVQFSKGSFTNRVQLKTASGPAWLTIPLHKMRLGQPIAEIEADGTDWPRRHLGLLGDAYREARQVDEMIGLVRSVYAGAGDEPTATAGRGRSLAELIIDSEEVLAGSLGIAADTEFVRASGLGIAGRGWERVLAIVRHFGGDVYVTGHGARHYLDAAAFEAAGVEVRYMDYACRPYAQLHGEFTPYVSALDALANLGSAAASVLSPRTVGWRRFATDS